MSLDTLLKIGRILRTSERSKFDQLKHHCDIRIPTVDKKSEITYWNIPVKENSEIDFENKSILDDQNDRKNLLYLDYKESACRNFRYLFGDIYNLKDIKKSFSYAKKEGIKFLEDQESIIKPFRSSLEKNLDSIQKLLNEKPNTFIHFDFQGKHWYDFEKELNLILKDLKLEKYFAEPLKDGQGYFLKNYLHRTLGVNDYKARTFSSIDEINDLMYAVDISKKAKITEKDIKIIVLPNTSEANSSSTKIEKFFERVENRSSEELIKEEEVIAGKKNKGKIGQKKPEQIDSLIDLSNNLGQFDFDKFDFLFTKRGGTTSPDYDLIEISGIQKSFIREVCERLEKIRQQIEGERKTAFDGFEVNLSRLNIFRCFQTVLGDFTSDKKKYQYHLLKVLPKIYTATYSQDPFLLPSFIEQMEYKVRDGTQNYNFAKYEYYFLVSIKNDIKEPFKLDNKEIKTMQDQKSYKIGLKLGRLAKPVSREIKSFEKSYVGQLSRRIAEKKDLIKFTAFINEKLCIHEKAFKDLKQDFLNMSKEIHELADLDYNKNECAFGFFESYFAINKKDDNNSNEGETNNG